MQCGVGALHPLKGPIAMFRNLFISLSSLTIVAVTACAGTDGSFATETSADDNVEALKVSCGGIADIQCPANYDCVITSKVPDAMGSCHKRKVCIQNQICAISGHFDHKLCKCVPNTCVQTMMCMKDSHWDATMCGCVADVTCKTLTCVNNYHCEEKGINGATIAVCIHN